MDPDPEPGGPKTYGADGSGLGSGSATLTDMHDKIEFCYLNCIQNLVLHEPALNLRHLTLIGGQNGDPVRLGGYKKNMPFTIISQEQDNTKITPSELKKNCILETLPVGVSFYFLHPVPTKQPVLPP